MESVWSHTKSRAVQAVTPVADSENVMVFAPDFRLRDFCHLYQYVSMACPKVVANEAITSWSEVNLKVLA